MCRFINHLYNSPSPFFYFSTSSRYVWNSTDNLSRRELTKNKLGQLVYLIVLKAGGNCSTFIQWLLCFSKYLAKYTVNFKEASWTRILISSKTLRPSWPKSQWDEHISFSDGMVHLPTFHKTWQTDGKLQLGNSSFLANSKNNKLSLYYLFN